MSYAAYLKNLLRPLGIYQLDGTYNGAELDSVGLALDGVEEALERAQREMCPLTAQGEGLERYLSLLPWRPAAETAEEVKEEAQIQADSFRIQIFLQDYGWIFVTLLLQVTLGIMLWRYNKKK